MSYKALGNLFDLKKMKFYKLLKFSGLQIQIFLSNKYMLTSDLGINYTLLWCTQ